jgi:hypothetical protein
MAVGFTKIRASMLDSTVWQLGKDARLLWLTMLLKKDRDQVVRAAVPGLAHAARLTVEETVAALEELGRADEFSQSKEYGGRRILPVDGGWFVVNGEKYRDYLTPDDRREYNRLKQREYRAVRKKKKEQARVEGATAAVMDNLKEAAANGPTTAPAAVAAPQSIKPLICRMCGRPLAGPGSEGVDHVNCFPPTGVGSGIL